MTLQWVQEKHTTNITRYVKNLSGFPRFFSIRGEEVDIV